MYKNIFAISFLTLSSATLVGCNDKQPDCNSPVLEKSVLDKISDAMLSRSLDETLKFSDKNDFIKKNHIELRNIKEKSADIKYQTKTCTFDISVQPVDAGSSRFVIENLSANMSINNEGNEVVSTSLHLGNSALKNMKRVETNNPTNEQKQYIELQNKIEQEKKEKQDKFKKEVLEIPADQYKFISDQDMTWLYLARTSKMDDEEMLNLVSVKYYNERDEFAKKDLAKTEIPEMKKKLNDYSQIKYVKFISPLGNLKKHFDTISGDPAITEFMPGAMPEKYDFDKKIYPLTMWGCPTETIANGMISNNQNVRMEWAWDTSLTTCEIKPKDETEARAWNDIFMKEKYAYGHDNYAIIYLVLDDELTPQGNIKARLVNVEVNYNGNTPLKLKTQ